MSDSEAQRVLERYGERFAHGQVVSLGGAGGFSGSRFWRVTTIGQEFALRRHPREVDPEQVEFGHQLIRQVAADGSLPVPIPQADLSGESIHRQSGFCYELTIWLPGKPLPAAQWTEASITTALSTLARVHLLFERAPRREGGVGMAVPPAIIRRWEVLRKLLERDHLRLRLIIDGRHGPAIRDAALRIAPGLERWKSRLEHGLRTAERLTFPIQPCLRDVWSDNFLFTSSDAISGLLDFAGAGWDSVATDVARLLGSLLADHPRAWPVGLQAYEAIRPLSAAERDLALLLDQANAVLSGWNWIRWLFEEDRFPAESMPAVLSRLEHFARRVEQLS